MMPFEDLQRATPMWFSPRRHEPQVLEKSLSSPALTPDREARIAPAAMMELKMLTSILGAKDGVVLSGVSVWCSSLGMRLESGVGGRRRRLGDIYTCELSSF